jgi:nicotinamidase-related amidase
MVIDMQNDFCNPNGALYVPGAENDVERLIEFIDKENRNIHQIVLTQDNHQLMDIAHPFFWQNSKGDLPPAFTTITYEDVVNKTWIPRFCADQVMDYLKNISLNGEFEHTIWPVHCLMGSEGAAIVAKLMRQVINWAKQGNYYDLVIKGTHPFTEHFGAFRANVPIADAPETLLNIPLINKLKQFDRILIAGEAKSHCVANSIKQLFDFPDIVEHLVILDDCMSNVTHYELLAVPIFEKALMMGVKIESSKNVIL